MKSFFVFLLVFCGVVSIVSAKPVLLKVSQDKILEGTIKVVQNSTVEFQLLNGRVVLIPMRILNSSGQRTVKSWILKQGGSEKYASWIKARAVKLGKC